MLQFDEKIDRKRLEQFAKQIEHVHPNVIKQFEDHFKNDQSPAFYTGLLSAYSNSYVLMQNANPNTETTQTLGCLVAFLSDKILKNEWYS